MAEPEEINGGRLPPRVLWGRLAMLVAAAAGVGAVSDLLGLEVHQAIAASVFAAIILGTLFFWSFRLAIAFVGIGVLILTNSLNIPHFVEAAALPVILFLVGMMVVVGALRDLGFFTWVVQSLLSLPRMTGRRFVAASAVVAALLACAVDEVTSIIFMVALIFQVCNRLKLDPSPYVILCVLCTNIGSAGTMLGNPVGIYIGTHAGLTFQDFLRWAFPAMILALAATIGLGMVWFRRDLDLFDARLRERMERNLSLVPRVRVPYRRALAMLVAVLAFIAVHHQVEQRFGLEKNSVLLVAPLVCAGVVMLVRYDRARHYLQRDVDWWTLVFFMLLFAVAGTLEFTGVTHRVAESCVSRFGHRLAALVPVVMGVSALGSAVVDNVIFVAAFAPVIERLGHVVRAEPLWWALLFGACFGGNITLIGSTANIVALGMLERDFRRHIRFVTWLKVGSLSALLACGVAWAVLALGFRT